MTVLEFGVCYRRRTLSLVTACALLLVPNWLWAGVVEGDAAYRNGDYDAAAREWTPAAQKGESEAEYGLGVLHARGLGVIQDYQAAFSWFSRAARHGHVKAQYVMGMLHAEGNGTEADYPVAAIWFAKAAKTGLPQAQVALGNLYAYGYLGKRDLEKATYWLTLAAERNYAPAQAALARVLSNSRNARRDLDAASRLRVRAADLGNADGQYLVAEDYAKSGDFARAIDLLVKAAEQGHADAQATLGRMYLYGEGMLVNHSRAFDWLCRAAAQGNSFAFHMLATIFERGDGQQRDALLSTALRWVASEVRLIRGERVLHSIPSSFGLDDLAATERLADALKLPGNFQKALDDHLKKTALQSPTSRARQTGGHRNIGRYRSGGRPRYKTACLLSEENPERACPYWPLYL